MLAVRLCPALVLWLGVSLAGCSAARNGGNDPDPPATADLSSPDASQPDLWQPPRPDLGYACGQYAAYRARVEGVVRSPCDYDVSKILSIGGDVKTRITPPTINMDFPDGTSFTGSTNADGSTFSATRTTRFPYSDGCTWQATETLSGSIDQAGSCGLKANYTYREAPIAGSGCALPCTIDAQVAIDRVSIIIG